MSPVQKMRLHMSGRALWEGTFSGGPLSGGASATYTATSPQGHAPRKRNGPVVAVLIALGLSAIVCEMDDDSLGGHDGGSDDAGMLGSIDLERPDKGTAVVWHEDNVCVAPSMNQDKGAPLFFDHRCEDRTQLWHWSTPWRPTVDSESAVARRSGFRPFL
jgi:hypothetical protein